MFASRGEITPPWGVPWSLRLIRGLSPGLSGGSATGASSQSRMSLSTEPSTTRICTHAISCSCGIVSKYPLRSASYTALLPSRRSNTNSKVVLVGHSMGALILEKALSQAIVGSLLASPNKSPKSPADLVLLINSAAPSIYARQLMSMLSRSSGGGESHSGSNAFSMDRPLIISATSKGDWATGTFFPIGMRIAGWTRSFRDYDADEVFKGKQSAFYRTTAGHNTTLLSHEIVTTAPPKKRLAAQTDVAEQRNQDGDPYRFEINNREYRIHPIANAVNRTPYWVIRVPKTIVK